MKKNIIVTVFLLLLVLAGGYWWQRGSLKRHFGILPGSYLVGEFSKDEAKALSYRVILDFPAQSAISFYEDRMNAKGWMGVEWKGVGNLRHWNTGRHTDPDSNKPVCKYTYQSAWANPGHDRVILMTLSFTDVYDESQTDATCPAAPKDNGLVVLLQELPMKSK